MRQCFHGHKHRVIGCVSCVIVFDPFIMSQEKRVTKKTRTLVNRFTKEQIEEALKMFAKMQIVGPMFKGEFHQQSVVWREDGAIDVFTELTEEV